MLVDFQQPPRSFIMTEEKKISMDRSLLQTKTPLRLTDSLEYYKDKNILTKSTSPPSSSLSLTMIQDEDSEGSDDSSSSEEG